MTSLNPGLDTERHMMTLLGCASMQVEMADSPWATPQATAVVSAQLERLGTLLLPLEAAGLQLLVDHIGWHKAVRQS